MKALKRFYGKSGTWYDVGHEVSKDDAQKAPKGFVQEEEKKKETKAPTKRKRVKSEDKNGKPKTDNK